MNQELYDKFYSPGSAREILQKIHEEINKGKLHILYSAYQRKFGYNENIVIPYYDEINKKTTDLIIINNPDEVEMLVENHVKKTPYLKKILLDSIISTTSVEHWKDQRKSFQPAFSLEYFQQMIDVSDKRTRFSVNSLIQSITSSRENKITIDIYDFFLNETLAQLQLAMFGFSDNFQNDTNAKIRKSFRGEDDLYARTYAFKFLDEVKKSSGPLSEAMNNRDSKLKTGREEFGNAMILTFAGHDTTANTLTWLIFELCRNREHYDKLKREVDLFWSNRDSNSGITYKDFKKLPFMTRCIAETLRLWTSIPNGTSRELQTDQLITGKNGEKILVKKGTYIQIPNWTRHRNPLLWGDDCEIFNPMRDFKDDEIWGDMVIASFNPNSNRYSPFTYGPRDCIGKNFSQIEIRIILLHLLKNFDFFLPDIQRTKYSDEYISFNGATLSPRSIKNKRLTDKDLALFINVKIREDRVSKL